MSETDFPRTIDSSILSPDEAAIIVTELSRLTSGLVLSNLDFVSYVGTLGNLADEASRSALAEEIIRWTEVNEALIQIYRSRVAASAGGAQPEH